MATKYGKKKRGQNNVLYTIFTVILISAVFLAMVSHFYVQAEDEAYEMLHIQTKQIKDDLILQIKSDRENLITMANFAAKLKADGESYDRMFESFKPIGLFSNIGILNPDNVFVTKVGSIDLNGKISFAEEAKRGEYITGRVHDLTRNGKEIIRSAVPIKINGETVGILYGVIKLETIGEKYQNMAKDLDAQLFVYDKPTGKFVIDTINVNPGQLSHFKNRKFNDGYTYEALETTDKGYSSFRSIFRNEDLYLHYSTIEDFDWGIILARYESQVFEQAHETFRLLLGTFGMMALIMLAYLYIIMKKEKNMSGITAQASNIRKLLLEVNQQHGNISEALKSIQTFSNSRSAFFVDTDGEEFDYESPERRNNILAGDEKKYFIGELFNYSIKLHNINRSTVGIMKIIPDRHLSKTNPELFSFLNGHSINAVSLAIVTDKNNHVSVLGVINPSKSYIATTLLEEIAVCFSIAVYNKKYLNRTEIAATTDSLTGAFNRASYKKDVLELDKEKPQDFACIYIDVNELHIMNNRYGHAAGDEMLIYIANTLKEAFFGHSVYRMGGDEFLVFAKDVKQEQVKNSIEIFVEQLKNVDYKVAIGISYRQQNSNCEEMVREAEIRMYEEKARYYQNKEQMSAPEEVDKSYIQTKTGIREIDAMLSILKKHYNGIYRVSLKTDAAHRILMPAYLGYNEEEKGFSRIFTKYINEAVHPDFHRAVTSFLNYDAIKKQIADGGTPKITYKKTDGECVVLRVYALNKNKEDIDETLWVFEKK